MATALVPATQAAPVIPDDSPIANGSSQANPSVENPSVTVTFPDGSPVGDSVVHRGDQLVVHGRDFDPEANKGGFPVPVPPGTPNGVFVLYGGFPDNWKPSQGAPAENRTHPHDRMAWVMPPGTLEKVPGTVINMRRVLARVHQPMDENGNFDAVITVDPPEETTGDNFGVYIYAAAGSVNEAEEFYIPIPYSPQPGPNTPEPGSPDLVFSSSVVDTITTTLGGGLKAKGKAVTPTDDTIGFTLVSDDRNSDGQGVVKYSGTADMTIKFSVLHVVVRDPWIEYGPRGTIITAEVSKRPDVGPDETRRIPIALVLDDNDGQPGQLITTVGAIERAQ
ncbi:HtaA protein [Corynebacterium sp. TAE3-ERU12]|nr:HtaA protein [Corynebacterium sp. TAE3-ERU12]